MSATTTTDDAGAFGPYAMEPDLPPKVSALRQKLYRKAKTEPGFRFYSLYDGIHRPDVLRAAFSRVASNDGAPGVDGIGVADVERREGGVNAFLDEIQRALSTKTYRSEAVRRCYIAKPDGRQRPLGIPTVRDRVVQTATLLVLEPVFEAGFHECSYGFRPKRSAHDAIGAVQTAIRNGMNTVIDADLQSYFDSIPHEKLMRCVQQRVADRSVLGLIRKWLNAPIEEREATRGRPRRFRSVAGTPQGGVISLLLANIYLHWLDVLFHRPGGPGAFAGAKLVRYADDLVVLARYVKGSMMSWLTYWLEERMGLKLHPGKTRIVRVEHGGDRFDFLGYSFQIRQARRSVHRYLHAGPSPKALVRARARIREYTARTLNALPVIEVVRRLNAYLRGWSAYFSLGQCGDAYASVNTFSIQRLYRHLYRRSQRPYRPPGGKTWHEHLRSDLGLLALSVAGVRRPALR